MSTIPKKQRTPLEIELSSFADVAFLLIIFFILTTSLVRPQGKEIVLPSTQEPKNKTAEQRTPTVALIRERLQFGTDEDKVADISLPELRVTLYGMDLPSKSDKERMIVVNVGEEVSYQRYYEVVTAISAAGGVVALMEEVE